MSEFTVLGRKPFFSASCGYVRDWAAKDVVYFGHTVDFENVERLRASFRETGSRPPSYTAVIVKAISLALRDHPKVNRLVFDRFFFRRLVQLHQVHAVVAVEREFEGEDIAVPTILRHTDRMPLSELSDRLQAAIRARPEDDPFFRKFATLLRHAPVWLSRLLIDFPARHPKFWIKHHGGNFLLTSPAKYGVQTILVKISWPLAFSFGLVKPRPVAVDGCVEIRPTTDLTLAWDRRLTTGAVMARFFNDVVQRLERAELETEVLQPAQAELATVK